MVRGALVFMTYTLACAMLALGGSGVITGVVFDSLAVTPYLLCFGTWLCLWSFGLMATIWYVDHCTELRRGRKAKPIHDAHELTAIQTLRELAELRSNDPDVHALMKDLEDLYTALWQSGCLDALESHLRRPLRASAPPVFHHGMELAEAITELSADEGEIADTTRFDRALTRIAARVEDVATAETEDHQSIAKLTAVADVVARMRARLEAYEAKAGIAPGLYSIRLVPVAQPALETTATARLFLVPA
jgi:hypothetical protein